MFNTHVNKHVFRSENSVHFYYMYVCKFIIRTVSNCYKTVCWPAEQRQDCQGTRLVIALWLAYERWSFKHPRIKITYRLPSAFDSHSADQEIPCSSGICRFTKLEIEVVGGRSVRGIFGPKRDKLRGKFRKLRNEKLQNILSTWYC